MLKKLHAPGSSDCVVQGFRSLGLKAYALGSRVCWKVEALRVEGLLAWGLGPTSLGFRVY